MMKGKNGRIIIHWLIVVYTVLLVVMNFIRIFDDNYWLDEAFTVVQSRMGLWEMVGNTAEDVHPPVYLFWVKILCLLFGEYGWVYHLSGLIPYIVLIIIAYVVVRKEWGNVCYLLFISFASLLKSSLTFTNEIRMYYLGALFVFVTFLAMRMILTKNRIRDYVIFGIASMLAAYTHYYCLISVSIMHVLLLCSVFIVARKSTIRAFITSVCFGISYLPWLFVLIKSFKRTKDDYWMSQIPTVKSCLLYIFDSSYLFSLIMFLCSLIAILTYYITKFNLVTIEKGKGLCVRKINLSRDVCDCELLCEMSGWITYVGTFIVGIGVSIVVRPMFITRYLFPVCCICWLLTSIAISKLGNMKFWLIPILGGSLLLSGIVNYSDIYNHEKDQCFRLKKTINNVSSQLSKDDILLTDEASLDKKIFECYFPDNRHFLCTLDIVDSFEKNKTYWLFWTVGEFDTQILEAINNKHFSMDLIVKDGNIGTCDTNVYKLTFVGN